MLPAPRLYHGDSDLAMMCALLQEGRAARCGAYYVHTGDLLWWLYYPPIGASWWEHLYLWDDPADPARLLGWALLAPDGETADVYYQPELRHTPLAPAMFAWAEAACLPLARAAGRDEVGVFWVALEDTLRVAWLEERGYRVRYQDTALALSLASQLPEPILPPGFEARRCRGLDEVAARARAQYGAFDSQAPFEAYLDRFCRFMQSPAYAAAVDTVIAAPDGQIAAFCLTWTDGRNRVGLFEPVGTAPAFQRMGLGRAVMLAGLRCLQQRGMREAIVCTGDQNTPAIRLYEAVGFRQYTTFRFYARKLA